MAGVGVARSPVEMGEADGHVLAVSDNGERAAARLGSEEGSSELSALGGLGGCPFAQDLLVGNIPTERVLEALGGRGIPLPLKKSLDSVLRMSSDIAQKHSTQVVH